MPIRDVDVPAVLARLGIEFRRKRHELWAPCPFHRGADGRPERTPSWRMHDEPADPRHGAWQCFGSCPQGERSGSIVDFVRRVLGLQDRKAAWKWIKGADVEREEPPPPAAVHVETSALRAPGAGMTPPRGVIVAPVAVWPSPARHYLNKTRAVPAAQAERWGLGYAATGRLAGRIYLPVHDRAGRLLNYTGRLFAGSGPKTREPDKEERADKGGVFGERRWPPPGPERRVVVATEGGLDALAVERAVPGALVGALFGSEVLPGHLLRLGSFAAVVVCSDPDDAGDKMHRVLRAHLVRHARVVRAVVPDGKDAAKLGETDPKALREILLRALADAV